MGHRRFVLDSITGLLSSLTELVLPRVCLGCGRDGIHWCRACFEAELRPALHRPDPCPAGLPELAAAAAYSGSVRSAVLAAKERDRRELDAPLGAALAAAVGLLISSGSTPPPGSGSVWLVPVPASPAARRERGRDHVADWGQYAARFLRAVQISALCSPVLRRIPGGLDSVGLDAGQRAANLCGAFAAAGRVRAPSRETAVVIIDDIVTTGATLSAASSCLSAALALPRTRIQAAVVAATQRHRFEGVSFAGDTGRSLAQRELSY